MSKGGRLRRPVYGKIGAAELAGTPRQRAMARRNLRRRGKETKREHGDGRRDDRGLVADE